MCSSSLGTSALQAAGMYTSADERRSKLKVGSMMLGIFAPTKDSTISWRVIAAEVASAKMLPFVTSGCARREERHGESSSQGTQLQALGVSSRYGWEHESVGKSVPEIPNPW